MRPPSSRARALPCDVALWEMVLEAADGYTNMSEEEQIGAVEYAREANFIPLFPI
jgi:hypothetical protein